MIRDRRALTRTSFLVASVLFVPLAAWAQTTVPTENTESPQRFAFEARFGPYYPDVDENVDETRCGSGPYETIFGTKSDLLSEFEFDFQFLNIFIGTLAVGGSIGVFHAEDKALQLGTCETSNDETSLWLLPLSLQAVLRFDIFAERWNVPLVPYAKIGLVYAIWFTTDENGISTVTADNGEAEGFGGSIGMRIAGGLMLRLDWLEPRTARTFDNEFGVNHSYIFFEYFWNWVDGFGQEGRMNVSDATWTLGVALEF